MSASNAFENALLLLLFNNTNIANIGDATGLRGSSSAGSLYISFHTADPGEAGDQTTNETTYTGHARVAVARSGAGFTVTGDTVVNAATITSGTFTAGSDVVLTHFSIGTASSGTGVLLLKGALANPVTIGLGNPVATFAAGQLSATAA